MPGNCHLQKNKDIPLAPSWKSFKNINFIGLAFWFWATQFGFGGFAGISWCYGVVGPGEVVGARRSTLLRYLSFLCMQLIADKFLYIVDQRNPTGPTSHVWFSCICAFWPLRQQTVWHAKPLDTNPYFHVLQHLVILLTALRITFL